MYHPSPEHAAISTSLQQIVDSASRGTVLELCLISLALVTLMAITLLPSARENSQSRRGQLPSSVGAALIVVTLVAYALTFTSLLLGWTGLISLDALVTIVFPLSAALMQIPKDTLSDYLLRTVLRSNWHFNEYLRLTPKEFAFIKVGYPCGDDANSGAWCDNFGGRCKRTKCKARIFLFRLPETSTPFPNVKWFVSALRSSLSRRLVASFHRHPNHSCGCTHLQEYDSGSGDRTLRQWEGERIAHTKHIVELRATLYGASFRVWNAVSSGAWLINKPWSLYLESQDQVLEGLSLISEICAIGNLALFLRKRYFVDELRDGKRGKRRGHWYHQQGRTALIHKFFIEELDLVDWNPSYFKRIADGKYNSPESFSVMFFVLIRKSDHLRRRIAVPKFKPQPRSAHALLRELWRHSDGGGDGGGRGRDGGGRGRDGGGHGRDGGGHGRDGGGHGRDGGGHGRDGGGHGRDGGGHGRDGGGHGRDGGGHGRDGGGHGRDGDGDSFDAFVERLNEAVDYWLVSWGCERSKLNAVRSRSGRRLNWPARELLSGST